MPKYYDGTKLLSMKDLDGNTPEIYMVTSNRTAGKTTYFNKLVFNRWLKKKQKFMLIDRFKDEMDGIAERFFKDIQGLYFPEWEVYSVKRASGTYQELFARVIGEDKAISCGYACALNSADKLKKMSHFFSDTSCMVFDEFQSETKHYCPNEISKFQSLHKTVARGQGKQRRYVPVYMMANPVTILNPYYVNMGISDRLNSSVRFLRGHGYVLEQGYNEDAALAQLSGGFDKAFSGSNYQMYSAEGTYLNDSTAFIEIPNGKGRYLATVKYDNCYYAIRSFDNDGIVYCDNRPDSNFPSRIAVTTDDHNINYIMLRNNDLFISNMRYFFERGCFRFKDMKCKEAILKLLSY